MCQWSTSSTVSSLTSLRQNCLHHLHSAHVCTQPRSLSLHSCDHMIKDRKPVGHCEVWRSDLHLRDRMREREEMRDRGWEREKCCAGEKLNQWLNYCMIAHSPKTWVSFGRKYLIIGFRPCQTHAIPPTNGSVRKNWASWVREGQKEARRQKAYCALLSFLP